MGNIITDQEAVDAYAQYYEGARHGWEERYVWTVKRFLGDSAVGLKVLEVGCGDGGVIELLHQHNEVFGVDVSQSGVTVCQQKGLSVSLLDASTEPLPFTDDAFDLVICLETLEHLKNPQYAVDEIRRVLKDENLFITSVPNPKTGHPFIYPGLFHYRNFSAFLEQNGFGVVDCDGWGRAAVFPSLHPRLLRALINRSALLGARLLRRFPYFWYGLWTFKCINHKSSLKQSMFVETACRTSPSPQVNK